METPGSTDAPAPAEPALPTGTGIEDAATPEEGGGINTITKTPTVAEAKVFECDIQSCEASGVLLKGC